MWRWRATLAVLTGVAPLDPSPAPCTLHGPANGFAIAGLVLLINVRTERQLVANVEEDLKNIVTFIASHNPILH